MKIGLYNAVRRAARLGDAWFVNPHSTGATIRRHLALYRQELRDCGKSFPDELPGMKEIFCAKDKTTALGLAGPYLLGKYKDYAKWGQDKAMPDDESFDKPLHELLEDRFILGSPDECVEQLNTYHQEFGVNHFILRSHWAGIPLSTALHSLRLLSNHVIPALRQL